MEFYEVLVSSQRFHGEGALTYCYGSVLRIGQVVIVPLQRQTVVGVVVKRVERPSFSAKEIKTILDIKPLPQELIGLISWLREYYPAPYGQLLTLVLPSTLAQKSKAASTNVLPKKEKKQPVLTEEQRHVSTEILSSKERMHLLHGETGTGKTRVYIELIKNVLSDKKSAMLLTPEIGLTTQLTETIEDAFPGKTVVLHSNLTPAQRRNRWMAIANSLSPQIIIGPRSALFAPIHLLGLIILDEAHDGAYKQEQAPYYQTTRVAAKLGELHKAKVVLGTATPLIADYYAFQEKKLPIHRMTELATQTSHTSKHQIIDLRNRDNLSKSSWLSKQLLDSIEKSLSGSTQSLLFLNRRGSARVVLCQNCGWHGTCPNCDVTLTYHADSHSMQCHTCGYKTLAPSSCPVCEATELAYKSVGTKAIAAELKRLFPNATIARLDGDNTKSERLENQFESIRDGSVDIIVGTQVVAKGLDLPRLGLVGVVLADTGLNFPDYTAEERTFQLLTQVTGRASRGHRDTEVIIQTFNPENITIALAAARDFDQFYKHQIAERQLFGFPPFKYLLKIRVDRASSNSAKKTISELAEKIRLSSKNVQVSDAAPAFVEKTQGKYRWQVILKSNNRTSLIDVIANLPKGVYYDIDPSNLL
jgi:primosomal protein N' (replication factor Y)